MECGGKCLVVTLTHSDYYFCVWWWSHLHGDWLPHVLISSNVQSDHKWEHWVTLWQHFFMTTRAELGREHQPAIFSWSTDSDGEHKTRPGWQLSGEGKGSHFSAFLLKTLIHFPKPWDVFLNLIAEFGSLESVDINVIIEFVWPGQVVVRWGELWWSVCLYLVSLLSPVSSLPMLKLPENVFNGVCHGPAGRSVPLEMFSIKSCCWLGGKLSWAMYYKVIMYANLKTNPSLSQSVYQQRGAGAGSGLGLLRSSLLVILISLSTSPDSSTTLHNTNIFLRYSEPVSSPL